MKKYLRVILLFLHETIYCCVEVMFDHVELIIGMLNWECNL